MDEGALFKKLLDTGLPLAPHLGRIRTALEEGGIAVVRADPGSGKSTLVPLALMEKPVREGRILMLEPRRAAAVGLASRMAEILGEEPGGRVGYSVRLERKVSERTRIEVLTEGLLVRRIQGDPELRGVSTLIFDEFHEHSVHTDLALALSLDLRRMGSPVKILIMSATLDTLSLAAFFDESGIRVIDCPGRVFPVDISYRPLPLKAPLGREAAGILTEVLREFPEGDVLVFLPGRREIADAAAGLGEALPPGEFEVLPLHGGLALERQRRIVAPEKNRRKRRIILSTNLAETSLTIPGITVVLDSGLTRMERYHLPTGMNRLVTGPESRSSAEQRAGRAGRLSRGRCIRLWAEPDGRPLETEPEIRRTDLSALVLECLIWGVRDREGLPWLEKPGAAAWAAGLEVLRNLGAVDGELNPRPRGREMVRLGLEVRLGALCIAGKEGGRAPLACALAALLSMRDGSLISADGDLSRRLALLRSLDGIPGGRSPETAAWVERIREIAADLLSRLFGEGPSRRFRENLFSWKPEEEADAGELLAAAFPDRIAGKQDRGRFRFPSGREARIEGPLETAEWIVAAELDAGERLGRIRLGAPLSKESALAALEGRMEKETGIVWKGLIPRTVVVIRAGRLSLGEERRKSRREEAARDLGRLLCSEGISLLPWDGGDEGRESPRELLERIRFFALRRGTDSDWSDGALAAGAEEWLGPFCWEGTAEGEGPAISGRALGRALEARLGFQGKKELDALVPRFFLLRNGKKRPLAYGGGEPVLRVRLQDAFGITGETTVLSTPISFHLLSPADRPVQITRDLPGFWAGSYGELRRELRGRYPKHFWPEDPRQPGDGNPRRRS